MVVGGGRFVVFFLSDFNVLRPIMVPNENLFMLLWHSASLAFAYIICVSGRAGGLSRRQRVSINRNILVNISLLLIAII